MKILIGYQFCTTGGVETAIKNRIQHIDFNQHSVELLFFNDFGGKKIFEDLNCKIFIEYNKEKIKTLINNKQYDYIISIDTPELIEIATEAKYTGKIVLEVHTTYHESLQYLKSLECNKLSFIVVPSQYQAVLIREYIEHTDIKILPNSIDELKFDAHDLGVTYSKPILAWVGRIDSHKNWRLFLEICRELKKNDSINWEFWMIGGLHSEEKEVAAMQQLILDYDLFTCFKWIPFLEYSKMHNLYNYIRQSNGGFISTSKNESFGMTILEAMSCGCPVISNNVGALSELVNKYTGLLLEMDCLSPADIANEITMYFSNEENMKNNKETAYKMVKKELTSKVVSRKFLDLLEI